MSNYISDYVTDAIGADEDYFEVTFRQVIGKVTRGEGQFNPIEAAFLIIARHNSNGEYQFLTEEGQITVTVQSYPPTD